MARRAKTSFKPIHLIIIFGLVALVAFGGFQMLHRTTETVAAGTDLSLHEYMENSNALGGNAYRLEGVVSERLDNWRPESGRLFSVLVEEGGESAPVTVLIPAKFGDVNIQRNQRYRFTVKVQAETGLLEVQALSKA